MKHLIKLFYLTAFIAAFAMFMRAEVPFSDGLESDTFEKSFVDASKENKPLIVLVSSNTCYSSRVFLRKVVNTTSIQSQISSNFVYVKADVATREGKHFARKNGVFALPAVFFISNDKTIKYKSKLSLDSAILQNEMNSFIKCVNMKDQINLYMSTNNVSLREAQIAIAEYYAKHDQKTKKANDLQTAATTYTLGMSWFADFEKAYIEKSKEPVKKHN